MTAAVVDHLAVANWQRAGDKRATRPTPVPRPGLTDPDRPTTTRDQILKRLASRKQVTDGR